LAQPLLNPEVILIYIIDDDESGRSAFELLFESVDMESMSFESVEEFLFRIKICRQDILILDLQLPGMNGTNLLMKFNDENVHIPVIIATAHDEPHNRELCMQYGVKAYLIKPIDGKVLIDLIKFNYH
jgi:two-component system nitrogen regulation response regulator GlnG